MTDLYAALEVERDAPAAAIRRAYRKAAKRAHPDAGGSREKFATVTTALAVLTDAERRKHYDQTGKIEEPPVDDRQAKAMNLVMGKIAMIVETCQKRHIPVEEIDIIGDAMIALKREVDQSRAKVAEVEGYADKSRKLAAKFKEKKGKVNRIGPMIAQWGAEHERTAAKGRDAIELIETAMKILNEHTFAHEPRAW